MRYSRANLTLRSLTSSPETTKATWSPCLTLSAAATFRGSTTLMCWSTRRGLMPWMLRAKPRHSVRGLMQDLMGHQLPAREGRKSNPGYLKLLARLQAAREELEAERRAKFKTGKDGKEVTYTLE